MIGPLSLEWTVVLIFGLTAVMLAALTAFVAQYRDARGGREWMVVLVLTTVWSASAAVKLIAPMPIEHALVAMEVVYGFLYVLTFFIFASAYTGRDYHERRWFVWGTAAVLGGLLVAMATNPSHHLLWEGIVPSDAGFPHLVHLNQGPLFWGVLSVAYVLGLVAIYLLVEQHFKSRYNTTSTLLIIGAAVMPPLANVVSVVDAAAIPGLDYTPFGLVVFGIATTAAIRQDLLTIVPVARDTAVEYSSEGMLIADSEGRIRDYNPVAEALFPDIASHEGDPVESVLRSAAIEFDRDGPHRSELTVTADGEDRDLVVTTAPIDEGGYFLGWSVVLTDITDQKRRERHLELVARVLRHNMSNEITVIQGQTEILRVHVDEEGESHLDTIVASGRRIIETSAKLRTIQDVVTDDRGRAPTNLGNCVEMVTERMARRYGEGTIEYDAPDVWVACTVGLVPTLENLLENAFEHNPSANARARVDVEVTETAVRITVADNGTGIPADEQRILEEGETPLKHSSGVGLWLVYRFVERSGRDLRFRQSGWGGSAVGFTLDRADPPEK